MSASFHFVSAAPPRASAPFHLGSAPFHFVSAPFHAVSATFHAVSASPLLASAPFPPLPTPFPPLPTPFPLLTAPFPLLTAPFPLAATQTHPLWSVAHAPSLWHEWIQSLTRWPTPCSTSPRPQLAPIGAPTYRRSPVKTPLLVTDAHPKQEFADILQLGLKASILAELYLAALEPRLPPGALSDLIEDLDLLGVVVPGARQVRAEATAATADQDAAVRAGYARVRAVRAAVRKSGAPREVKKAYGIGQMINPGLVRDVKAALNQVLDRASANPEEAAGLGIVKKDLDAMVIAHKAISAADKVQEQKRATAPQSTKDRNRTANRILKSVARIAGAGGLEFADTPELLAAFSALKSTRKKSAAKKGSAKKSSAKEAPVEAIDDADLAPDTLAEPLKHVG